jgi:5'(3')-deoxyribonucleotidase
MPRILLDADGCILDFLSPALHVFEVVSGKRYRPEEVIYFEMAKLFERDFPDSAPELTAEVYRRFRAPGWCLDIKPYEGAVEFVENLRQHADVVVVTSPIKGSRTWAGERAESLLIHFGFDSKHVVNTAAKQLVAGDSFLDDNPEHVDAWLGAWPKGVGVVMARSYNEGTTLTRVGDYGAAAACLIPPGLFR